ncbi:uncharacterized protein LOC101848501 [Aplysia californica]|uniref:Uncharacterized protein LOC101848501 n=1 Tax=Aplysia californica TaxID=6500 RepID=A0ABM0ZVA3_APLCA|nr:uncharacterized protein LOC101848501 [Aplysia californica]
MKREFQCLAYIKEESVPLQQLLITRGLDGRNRFHCWVLTSYVGGGEWPWRVLYQLPTPQCSLIMEVNVSAVSRSNAALYLDDRARSKACKPHEESKLHVTQNDVTKSSATNLSYIVPKPGLEKGSGYTEILVKPSPTRTPQTPHPPITDFHSTDPTVLGVYNKASSSLIGQNLYRKGYVVLLYLLLYGVLYKLSAR